MRRLVLTASGGPFRGRRREDLGAITPEQFVNLNENVGGVDIDRYKAGSGRRAFPVSRTSRN